MFLDQPFGILYCGNNSFWIKSTPWMIFHTCKCLTLPFVYTWISCQLIHCVNLSITWWPNTFNHECFTSCPIQRCALRGIKGNSNPRYFGPSMFLSFVNQLPTKIETSLFPSLPWCVSCLLAQELFRILIPWVDHEILDLLKDPSFYSCSLFTLVELSKNHEGRK
jgi:hypothetical protein